jgi:Concanavalin A-like lectin/glucanases superfamily
VTDARLAGEIVEVATYGATSDARLAGEIVEVAIYGAASDARLAGEIVELAQRNVYAYPYMNTVLADGPEVYWRIQETSNLSTLNDSSGNSRSATRQGSSGGTTGVATSLVLGSPYTWQMSSGDHYWASNANATDTGLDVGTGDYAYEMWLKLSNSTSNYVELASRDSGATGNGQIVVTNITTGVVRAWCGGTSLNGTVNILDNAIHHVVVTRESGTLKIYVDGVLDTSVAATGDTNGVTRPLRLGVVDGTYARPTGYFSHFAYYTNALNSTQVADHYAAGQAPTDISRALSLATVTVTPEALTTSAAAGRTLAPAIVTTTGATLGVKFPQSVTATPVTVTVTPSALGVTESSPLSVAATPTTVTVTASTLAPSLPSPPANDDFADAILLTGTSGTQGPVDNTYATAESGEPAHDENAASNSIWYKYVPASDGYLIVDTFAGAMDTVLAAYTGSAVNALTLVGWNDEAGSDLNTNNQSRMTLPVTSGTTYYIAVDGYFGAVGDIYIAWEFATATAPANDLFSNATVISTATGSNMVNTLAATMEVGEPYSSDIYRRASVWYKFVPPSTGHYTFNVVAEAEAGYVNALFYTGTTLPSLRFQYRSSGSSANTTTETIFAIRGTPVYIYLAPYAGDEGEITLSWSSVPVPWATLANDYLGANTFWAALNETSGPAYDQSYSVALTSANISGSDPVATSDAVFGSVFSFSGANYLIQQPPINGAGNILGSGSSNVASGSGKSWSAWVKMAPNVNGVEKTIVRLGWYGFYIKMHASLAGRIQAGFYDSLAAAHELSSDTRLDDGDWHLITMTLNRPNLRQTLYVDGVAVDSATAPDDIYLTATGSDALTIGRDGPFNQKYFTGQVADVLISYKEWTPLEVAAIYNSRFAFGASSIVMNAGFAPIAA